MYVCVYVCICMYVCTYVCMYVCVCVCMYAHMYVCMYVCMCVHILKASKVNFRLTPQCELCLISSRMLHSILVLFMFTFLFNDAVSVCDGRVISYGMCRMNFQLIHPRCVV